MDPANRLVARELERRWEGALAACSHIETEARAHLEALEEPLSAEEQAQLQHLAQDVPSLWHASSTSSQAKKRIVRCLIDNVVVSVSERDMLQAQVHWVGGEVTTLEVPKGKLGVHRYVTDPEVVALVRVLAAQFADDQIARILHRKRLKTSKGLVFNAQRVTNIRTRYDIPGHTRAKLADDQHVYTADFYNVYAYSTAQTLVQVLKQCGEGLTRENVLRQAANLKNLELPMLLPGIHVNTGPADYSPVEQMQLQRFDGKQWVLFGEFISP